MAIATRVGLLAAVLLARLATRCLYGISQQDSLSMSGAGIGTATAEMLAAIVPALRACR